MHHHLSSSIIVTTVIIIILEHIFMELLNVICPIANANASASVSASDIAYACEQCASACAPYASISLCLSASARVGANADEPCIVVVHHHHHDHHHYHHHCTYV